MDVKKTLAMKLLEGKNIPYNVYTYDGTRDAEEVAAQVGIPAERVFKTLVVPRPQPGKPLLVMLPADKQLDLKKLAKAIGEKKLKMATHRQAEEMTGLQVGGISALALLNKGFAVYIDASAKAQAQICVSAGERGLQVEVAVKDLVKLTGARYADVAE